MANSVALRSSIERHRGSLACALSTIAALCGAPGTIFAQSTAAPKVVLANGQTRYVGPVPAASQVPGLTAEFSIGMSPRAMLETLAPQFGIENPAAELAEAGGYGAPRAGAVRRYRQLHYGIPVIAAEVVMTTDAAGRFESLSGEVTSGLALDELTPRITPAEAREAALRATAKYHGLPEIALMASEPELSIYRADLVAPSSIGGDVLVWQLEVAAPGQPVNEYVLVDATTGALPLHFNQVDFALDRLTYTAGGTSVLPGTLLCDETQPTCTDGVNVDGDFAHIYAAHTYDFYFDRFGRDSIDDAGATIISSVDFGPAVNCPNAFWNGTQVSFCPGAAAADDVVAHELSHAVTQHTSGLFYWHQSGAINESLSDLFGELLDQTNGVGNDAPEVRWQLGEDWPGLGAIRNMEDPPQFDAPDRVRSQRFWTTPGDNGGVHINSGVNNKAVALLVDGGVFNGYTISGIGLDKTATLYYRVQTQHLTSGSDYADLYVALNQACQNMMADGDLDAADCFEVAKVTGAVEMNRDPGVREGSEAAVCPTGQAPVDAYRNGFETPADVALWTEVDFAGTGSWGAALLATDGVASMYTAGVTTASDYAIEMNQSVVVPDNAYLRFRHLYYQEFGGPDYYDGGIVEISTDDGVTWTDAVDYHLDGQGYGGVLAATSSNPQGGREAFVADSRGFLSTRYDLSGLAGGTVRVRFRNTSDFSVSTGLAWAIDDVRVYACEDDLSLNLDPVADAGLDLTVAPLVPVMIDGSASRDGDGTIESYEWVQLTGPAAAATTVGASLEILSPATPTQELLEFELTVTDNRGATSTDRVAITVINEPPTADAGIDLAHKPLELVQLAVAASDSDGSIASYVWSQTSGPAVALSSPFVQFPSFFAPPVVVEAVLAFDVTVTDNAGAAVTDQVAVVVTNDQPFADAGEDFALKPEQPGMLVAFASDPDGGIVAYDWVQVAGPLVPLAKSSNNPAASFAAPGVVTSDVLEFEVSAFDNFGAVATDRVVVTVTNDQPTIQMDPAQTIKPRDILVIKGIAADEDGGIVGYAWTQTSGPAVNLINPTFPEDAWFQAPSVPDTALLSFALTATDKYGARVTGTIDVSVVNDRPTSNAGIDADVAAGASVALTGSGADANGTIVSYSWRQVAGPPVSLSGSATARAQFMAPSSSSASVLTFELDVTDNDGAITTDSVTIRVAARPPEGGGGGGSTGVWTLIALLGLALLARDPIRTRVAANRVCTGCSRASRPCHRRRCI